MIAKGHKVKWSWEYHHHESFHYCQSRQRNYFMLTLTPHMEGRIYFLQHRCISCIRLEMNQSVYNWTSSGRNATDNKWWKKTFYRFSCCKQYPSFHNKQIQLWATHTHCHHKMRWRSQRYFANKNVPFFLCNNFENPQLKNKDSDWTTFYMHTVHHE